MQPVIRPLYLLHPDPELRSMLDRIPGGPYHVTQIPDWGALRDALRRSPPTAISVVDPFAGSGDVCVPTEVLRDLLSAFRSSTIMAALPVTAGASDVVRTLTDWGVAEIVDLVRERTPEALARRLRVVQGRTVQRLLHRALPDSVSGRTRALLAVAAEAVATGGQAPELAVSLGVTERTVARWCKRAELPPPRRVLVWLRILLAADLLDDPGRSNEAVARACGYAGGASLKGALRGLLETTPRDLRAAGAFRTVSTAFRAELFGIREAVQRRDRSGKSWLS